MIYSYTNKIKYCSLGCVTRKVDLNYYTCHIWTILIHPAVDLRSSEMIRKEEETVSLSPLHNLPAFRFLLQLFEVTLTTLT